MKQAIFRPSAVEELGVEKLRILLEATQSLTKSFKGMPELVYRKGRPKINDRGGYDFPGLNTFIHKCNIISGIYDGEYVGMEWQTPPVMTEGHWLTFYARGETLRIQTDKTLILENHPLWNISVDIQRPLILGTNYTSFSVGSYDGSRPFIELEDTIYPYEALEDLYIGDMVVATMQQISEYYTSLRTIDNLGLDDNNVPDPFFEPY